MPRASGAGSEAQTLERAPSPPFCLFRCLDARAFRMQTYLAPKPIQQTRRRPIDPIRLPFPPFSLGTVRLGRAATETETPLPIIMALRLLASAARSGSGGSPALFRLARSVTSSSNASQAQPQVAAAEGDVSRWSRELGVVRNDWT